MTPQKNDSPPGVRKRSGLLALALLVGVIAVVAAWKLPLSQREAGLVPPTSALVSTPVASPAQAGASVFPLGDGATGGQGQQVAGIACNPEEMTDVHFHAHLSLFVNGKQYQIPSQVGVVPTGRSGACLYAVHTHDASGMIHIESKPRTYRLGDFFQIWGESLTRNLVGPYHGRVTSFVNGTAFGADPRNISLTAYQQITLEVGSKTVKPPAFLFPVGQ